MSDGRNLIDTNVLVHAYVALEAEKCSRAGAIVQEAWEKGDGLTTLQNVCEFFFVVTEKIRKPMPVDQADRIVRAFLTSSEWVVLDRNEKTVLEAIRLVKQHEIPLWDALIAACMLENGIEAILTENTQDFERVPGIRAINPFK